MTLYRVTWIRLIGLPAVSHGLWFADYTSAREIVDYCNMQWTVGRGMFLHWVESREF